MLLGLYPPKMNNYVLEESQKYNAVPPIEGFDFGPWIEEMGLEALPHQTTIFPIQMNGWSYDYMLALDDDNCAKRQSERAAIAQQVKEGVDKVAKDNLPEVQQFFDKYGWESFCDYVSWAYTESVELNEQFKDTLDIDNVFGVCQEAYKLQSSEFNELESAKLSNLTTNEVRKHLSSQVQTWISQMPKTLAASQIELTQKPKKSLEGTAGTENPKYIMFWTNEKLMNLLALNLVSDETVLKDVLPLGPSSTILFEFTLLNGDLSVQTFVNDQLVST
mmetsp:Transcript_9811/g.16524  ORF Transcript_9811/g.16524 Transcript_9811/m.16524 type:complete len:276 (+) Transcript_9811:393-1220(+)